MPSSRLDVVQCGPTTSILCCRLRAYSDMYARRLSLCGLRGCWDWLHVIRRYPQSAMWLWHCFVHANPSWYTTIKDLRAVTRLQYTHPYIKPARCWTNQVQARYAFVPMPAQQSSSVPDGPLHISMLLLARCTFDIWYSKQVSSLSDVKRYFIKTAKRISPKLFYQLLVPMLYSVLLNAVVKIRGYLSLSQASLQSASDGQTEKSRLRSTMAPFYPKFSLNDCRLLLMHTGWAKLSDTTLHFCL